jgi:phosphatidylinositol-3,4,5-trisphosphate 3-phosphatase/dual-specificity protein phosphatase PTEN
VSQGKRRFQQDGYDLDLSYVTKRVVGMGFPAKGREGALELYNCGIVFRPLHLIVSRCNLWARLCHQNSVPCACAGLYRNPMPEVVSMLQRYHRDHYKVYNLCSERSYPFDQMLGPVVAYPSDDHQVRHHSNRALRWLPFQQSK